MKRYTRKLLAGCLAVSFLMTTVFTSNVLAATSKTQSVSTGVVSSEQRLFGIDRYETAAKITQEGWKETSEYAVLSAGMDENLVDALAAAPLAKLKNAPILLTEGDNLNPYAEAELKRLGVKNVYVTTGANVITKKVLDKLVELNITVVPLGGSDRYETALNIAKEMGSFNELVVATAWNNADALSVASIAAANGMPIILSDVNKIPDNVMSYIDSVKGNVSQTYVLGGTGALTDNVKNSLPNATRIGGVDRFDTNLNVLKTFANDLKYSKTYLANGEENHLADALTGAPLAALTSSPVVLTGISLPAETKEFVKLNLASDFIIFGGEGSVPSAISEQLSTAVVYSEDGAIVGSDDANKLMEIPDSIKITANNVTLKNVKTPYSVYIQGDNAVVDNVTISGTLFIDPGENGTANINNVRAGKDVVLSGAKDSIHLKNTEAGTLVVSSSSEVHVESSGTTKVGNTVVSSYAILDAAGGSLGRVEVVSVAGQAPVVTFKGTFDQPIVVSGAATIKADSNASIAKLEIAPEEKDQIITLDGRFTTVEVNKEAKVELSSNTTVTNVVTNVNAKIDVPSGATIGTLDKNGNEVPVTGSGSVGGGLTPSAGGGGGSVNYPAPVVEVTNVEVINAASVAFTTNINGATIKWNDTLLKEVTIEGKNTIDVPLMESDVPNKLLVEKSGYTPFKVDVVYSAPYDATATLGEWIQDRTEPLTWTEENDWITLKTKEEPANNWYAWQGRNTATGMGLTSEWMVETKVEITKEMAARNGIRTAIWLQTEGIRDFGAANQDGVIDWTILQYNKNSAEDVAGWQTWNSTPDPVTGKGSWVTVENDAIPTVAGIYTITMRYEKGTIYQYINGIQVNEYSINTDEGLSAPTHVILQSYSFGESYEAKWKVPTVHYINQYPVGAIFVSNEDELMSTIKAAQGYETIVVAEGTYSLPTQLTITKPITIIGRGEVTITPSQNFDGGTYNADKHLIAINGVDGHVQLENLSIRNSRRAGINVWESSDVMLKDIVSSENAACGLIVTNSKVIADNLNTSENGWGYGVNVDNGTNPSADAPDTSFKLNSGTLSEARQIVSDKGGVEIIAPGYSIFMVDLDMVHSANITSWYGDNNEYLDTSVNLNFDRLEVEDINSVKFSLYQDNNLLGTRFSTGSNLVTLLKDCAQYWNKTAETYKDVTGDRIMSAAFMNRSEESDNGYWVSSICTAQNTSVPNKLVVEVEVNNITYLSVYSIGK